MPEACCELWHFDETWVVCTEPEHHDGQHRAVQAGDHGIEATITWDQAPATVLGVVQPASTTDLEAPA